MADAAATNDDDGFVPNRESHCMTRNTVHFCTAGSMSPRCRCSVFGRNPVQAAPVWLGSDLHLAGFMIEEADPF